MKYQTVIIGVGQFVQRYPNADNLMSSIDLAGEAVSAALNDTGKANDIVHSIDVLAWVRELGASMPAGSTLVSRLKGADNPPAALARKLGRRPASLLHSAMGGDMPQCLVNEMAAKIGNGEIELALLAGAEAVANAVYCAKNNIDPGWEDKTDAVVEDRGSGVEKLFHETEAKNGLWEFLPVAYSLFENARRISHGRDSAQHRQAMAELFSIFSDYAKTNPYAMFDQLPDFAALNSNQKLYTSTYTAMHCAREKVNQGAALILCSEEKARQLGVDQSDWIYVIDGAEVSDKPIIERKNFTESASIKALTDYLFTNGEHELDEIDVFDCYSCFPIAVELIMQHLGLEPNENRPLTTTGGLPFFGGAGNNYSMHAIASMVELLRKKKRKGSIDAKGLVIANGGVLSKHAMGIYGINAPDKPYTGFNKELLEQAVYQQAQVEWQSNANGECFLEVWSLDNRPQASHSAIVIGRLLSNEKRFVAKVAKDDQRTIAALVKDMPTKHGSGYLKGLVSSNSGSNYFSIV